MTWTATRSETDEIVLTRAYTKLGEALGLDWAQQAANRFEANDQWERLLTANLAVTTIFTFVFSWNEFLFAFYLTHTNVVTLPIQIYNWSSQPQQEWVRAAAAAILVLMVMLLALNTVAILLLSRTDLIAWLHETS